MSGIAKRIRNIIRANMAPKTPDYIDSQRDLFNAKYEQLNHKKNEQGKLTENAWKKVQAWDNMISTKERHGNRYGQAYLSERAKSAVEQLLVQARSARDLAQKEAEMHQDTLNRIIDQLSQVEGVLIRLKNVDYALSIQNNLKQKALALNTSAMDATVEEFNMNELIRELRRVEYTTEALIELGVK